MVAQVASRPRLCLQVPATRERPRQRRRSVRRVRPGSLAWWITRVLDPQDLVAFKVVLAVGVFAVAGLIGP